MLQTILVLSIWGLRVFLWYRTSPRLIYLPFHTPHICMLEKSLTLHSYQSYSHSVPIHTCVVVASPIIHMSHLFHHTLLPSHSIPIHFFHVSQVDATLTQHYLPVQHRLPLSHQFLILPSQPVIALHHHHFRQSIIFHSHHMTDFLKHSLLNLQSHTFHSKM